jgi:hypothetical protein
VVELIRERVNPAVQRAAFIFIKPVVFVGARLCQLGEMIYQWKINRKYIIRRIRCRVLSKMPEMPI